MDGLGAAANGPQIAASRDRDRPETRTESRREVIKGVDTGRNSRLMAGVSEMRERERDLYITLCSIAPCHQQIPSHACHPGRWFAFGQMETQSHCVRL
jgi:hypothetical protein